MKPSEMVRNRYCDICPNIGMPWCKNSCVVRDIIEDLEEMEDEDDR